MPDLPPARTSTDQMLAALVGEVRGLRDDLARVTQPSQQTDIADDEVRLQEPDPPRDRQVTDDVDGDDVDVDDFHTGGGWYQLPGHDDKVRGRDNAIQTLRNG